MTDKEERLFQEINEYAREKGLHLEGYIPARCPIYVLNLSYFSKDNDPFYPIDRAIINILYHNPHTTGIPYIAWLLGFEKEIVESRINYHLIAEGFLRYGGHGEYVVADAGARKYMTKNGERPDVQVTGSVMVDGTTLSLLPQIFYNSNNVLRYFRQGRTAIPHVPLMGNDDPVLLRAVKKLEMIIKTSKFPYGLEEHAHNLEILSYDERVLEDAIIVFLSDDKGNISKQLYFYGSETNLDALKGVVERYYFYFDERGTLHNNGGVANNDVSSVVLNGSIDNFAVAIINRYEMRGDMKKIDIAKSYIKTIGGHYYLQLTKQHLNYSNKKRQVLADARLGHIAMKPGYQENGVFIVSTEADKQIKFLIDFEEKLKAWKEEYGLVNMDFIQDITKDKTFNWRKVLCEIDRFDDLESIDRMQFFKFE